MITASKMDEALKEMGLTVQTDGKHWIHTTEGRYAPLLSTIITLDEDGSAATIVIALKEVIPVEKRANVYELLNYVHGQSLWNVRFHLDETGKVFSIGRVMAWGKPFNPAQLGDVFFSLLVTTDRLYPCLVSVNEENMSAADAFERFFLKKESQESDA
jgi:hypothetical protein